MNLRPSGYEPDELPGCSTPRLLGFGLLLCLGATLGLFEVWFLAVCGVGLADLAATYSPTP